MAIINLFSKRQKVLRKEVPDVYEYTQIPRPLRVQIAHILRDLFGRHVPYDTNGCIAAFTKIEELLTREYGLFQFPSTPNAFEEGADQRVIHFVLAEQNHERVLDVVEFSFQFLMLLRSQVVWQGRVPQEKFDRAKAELNARFREHGIGYQYESGEIIRVDSQLIHAEVVKPALALLTAPEYAGANAEFLRAFEHYRNCAPVNVTGTWPVSVTVMVLEALLTLMLARFTRQVPSAPTTAETFWFSNETVTVSPGLPVPKTGTVVPRCRTMFDRKMGETVTAKPVAERTPLVTRASRITA